MSTEVATTNTALNLTVLGIDASIATKSQKALESGSKITSVKSPMSMSAAIAAAGTMKGMVKELESARRARLKPIEEAIKKFNAMCKEFSGPMEAEISRLERAASTYQLEQDRILRAKQEEEQRIRDAEAAKERAALETQVHDHPVRGIDNAVAALTTMPAVQPAVVAPQAIQGASVERGWDWDLVDAWALARHAPEAVELTVKAAVVNRMIKAGSREIPGIRIYEVATVTARSK